MVDIDPANMFEWDEANTSHIDVHRVEPQEAEDALLDPDRIPGRVRRVPNERRWAIVGATETGRVLFVVYTRRDNRMRVVAARDADEDERHEYFWHQRR